MMNMKILRFKTVSLVFMGILFVAGLAISASAQALTPSCSDPSIYTVANGGIFKQPLSRAGYAKTDAAGNAVPVQTDFKIKVKEISESVILDPNSQDNIFMRICVQPGAAFPWHTHPGAVVVNVKSGIFSLYDGDDLTCTGEVYGAGQAFVDKGHGHVHTARNESGSPVELLVLFLDVPKDAASPLTPVANPGNCSSKGF